MKDKWKKIQRTFYQNNDFAYYLIIFVILANVYTTIDILNLIDANFKIGFSVIFNIVLVLALFLCAIKIKIYQVKWVWFNFGFIIYLVFRNLVIYPKFYLIDISQIKFTIFINYLIMFCLLLSSLITIKKVKDQALYKQQHKCN
ncbi:MAG: hypothetical protein PHX62_09615 [Bacilli bacterium]|nr:hypothetical protein [Bacilli bacterium]